MIGYTTQPIIDPPLSLSPRTFAGVELPPFAVRYDFPVGCALTDVDAQSGVRITQVPLDVQNDASSVFWRCTLALSVPAASSGGQPKLAYSWSEALVYNEVPGVFPTASRPRSGRPFDVIGPYVGSGSSHIFTQLLSSRSHTTPLLHTRLRADGTLVSANVRISVESLHQAGALGGVTTPTTRRGLVPEGTDIGDDGDQPLAAWDERTGRLFLVVKGFNADWEEEYSLKVAHF